MHDLTTSEAHELWLKEQFLRPLLKEAVGCMPSPHLKLMSCGLKDGLEMS